MTALLFIWLTLRATHSGAEEVWGPWMSRVSRCDRNLANIDDFTHDPSRNTPIDSLLPMRDGLISGEAPLDLDLALRALSNGSFIQRESRGLARLVQPQRRAILFIDNFRDRIPKRDMQYVRSANSRGVTFTDDEEFEAILSMCANMPRYDYDRATGEELRDATGARILQKSWLSPPVQDLWRKMFAHPEHFLHVDAAWLPGQPRRLWGALIWSEVAGVVSGETMCFDPNLGSGIGKSLFYRRLENLEQRGVPWIDAREAQPRRMAERWGAVTVDRRMHMEMLRDVQRGPGRADLPQLVQ